MLILASQSPRRRELLERMGLKFEIIVADIDETMDENVPIEEEIGRISLLKAKAVQDRCSSEDIVIAADTMVCIDGKRLGKPKTEAEAHKMLQMLSDRNHQVISGVTVLQGERSLTAAEITHLHFRSLSESEIQAYIATGEPMDKAGAYGIQGRAAIFADKMDGDYYNVMGLPMCRLAQMLKEFGVEML